MNNSLNTRYLGLTLHSPLVPSASPLGAHLDSLREMEAQGAGALVLPSLFQDPLAFRALKVGPYAELIARAKQQVTIPVIASLSAELPEEWVKGAHAIAESGADALELNIYNLTLSAATTSEEIEHGYAQIVEAVTGAVKIPVAVKLSPFFTNLVRFTRQLETAGARGFILFNRFYQPDIDFDGLEHDSPMRLSSAAESRLPRRWLALLYRTARADLAASTGLHTGSDALKAILCGASVTQVCSVLLQRGIPWLRVLEKELREALERCHLDSLDEARGLLAHKPDKGPGDIEREEYRTALQGYETVEVPTWREEVPLHG